MRKRRRSLGSSAGNNAIEGFRGYPVCTIIFYGPTAERATKVVAGLIQAEGEEIASRARRFSEVPRLTARSQAPSGCRQRRRLASGRRLQRCPSLHEGFEPTQHTRPAAIGLAKARIGRKPAVANGDSSSRLTITSSVSLFVIFSSTVNQRFLGLLALTQNAR